MVDYKELAQKLIEKKFPGTEPLWKVKKKYEDYKDLWERAKKVVDPDTRDTAIFKEALKAMLSKAGKWIGVDLTKSPYYVLNQKGLDALFEAITAMDTINNARKLVSDAEAALEKLTPKVAEFHTTYFELYDRYYNQIKAVYLSTGWSAYVQQASMDHFEGSTRAEAEDEIKNALELAEGNLTRIAPTVRDILVTGFPLIANYAALAAAGASIVLSEKTADDKVSKLASSSSTVSHGFGSLEQARKQTERDLDALYSDKTRGKTLAERVNKLFGNIEVLMVNWTDLIRFCQSENILQVGIPGGGGWTLPWNLPLPPA